MQAMLDDDHPDSMLLDDLSKCFGADHVLYYTSTDYQMPLLAGNDHYRDWVTQMAPAFATIGQPLLRCEPSWSPFRSCH